MNTLLNWFESLRARLTRKERLRALRLEAQLAEARGALRFYGSTVNYPEFFMEHQNSTVLQDAGLLAREALRRTSGYVA